MYFTKVYNSSLIWTCKIVGLYGCCSKTFNNVMLADSNKKFSNVMKVALVC